MGETAAEACDDPARLAALAAYEVLDSPREPAFDSLVELASRICGTPVSVINLVESRRQWFKAEVGLGIRETPLDISICRHFLTSPGLTVVPDTRADPRLSGNPLVAGEPGFRFYAGCLLRTPEGHGLGTLCVLDHQPRTLTPDQRFALETLADQVMAQLELRLALRRQRQLLAQKALLLGELNHRVKNSLQLIVGIIMLGSRSLTDPAAQAVLEDIRGRVMSVAAVHEHLHHAGSAERIDLAAYLGSLVDELRRSVPGGIRLEFRACKVSIGLDLAVPLALIANELITNAVKHAYPDGAVGRIEVALSRQGHGSCLLTVADDGVGMPAAPDVGSGRLGRRLLQALTQQIGARLAWSEAGPGTRAMVTFSEAQA